MIEINLIPDVKQELIKAQRARGIVISASIITSIIAAAVVVLLLVYIYGVQNVRGAYLDGQITTKGQELSKVEDLSKILTIQNQLATISQLNGEKVMSSRMFDVMSAITPPGDASISFSQINVSPGGADAALDGTEAVSTTTGGQIQLEGQTASYDTMELFKKRIENTSFQYNEGDEKKLVALASNISTTDISYGEDANGNKVLRFTIAFDYPAELFSSATASQQLAFKLTANGNVTDSYTGIPRFSERASDLEGDK